MAKPYYQNVHIDRGLISGFFKKRNENYCKTLVASCCFLFSRISIYVYIYIYIYIDLGTDLYFLEISIFLEILRVWDIYIIDIGLYYMFLMTFS